MSLTISLHFTNKQLRVMGDMAKAKYFLRSVTSERWAGILLLLRFEITSNGAR
jgi:hypothetical protein